MKTLLRNLGKRILPYELLRRLKIVKEFRADRRDYAKYAGPDDYAATPATCSDNFEMQITKDYHRIEKGLALPDPKVPFGSAVLDRMRMLIPAAATVDRDAPYLEYAKSAQLALEGWNNAGGGSIDEVVAPEGATPAKLDDPEAFFGSRRSVRNFSATRVPRDLIERAVSLAMQSPSVCNRQAWRVHLFDDPGLIGEALDFQNGNGGFRHTIPAVALVTGDRRMFAGANERNQVWIDGGLFSMSFVWALHGLGVGTCMLNMSQPNAALRRLRQRFQISDSEAVVMFIAIGYPAAEYRVARSPRRSVGSVATWHR